VLVPDAVNGKPAIQFDGVSNVLEIANSPSLQPQMGDWTVLFVAKRLAASQGDYPEIIGSRPWVSGLDLGWAVSFNGSGLICSHLADGVSGHDVTADLSISRLSQTAFQMWQVQEDRAGGTTTFYVNGDSDVVRTPAMPANTVDQADSIFIGREIGGANNRRANMDLAEVLIYNRVLSKS
jgi:Concanavalin A-like lectin/glucanases superfamily